MMFQVCKWLLLSLMLTATEGLYPRESPSREVKKLDGIWDFQICSQDDQDVGFREKWFSKPLHQTVKVIPMPVPSSFNDITQNRTIRDYLGWSWYDTSFYVPNRWKDNQRIILRFDSAHYLTVVYLNGVNVLNHTGGHLPFENDVTEFLSFTGLNILTVALNNTLTQETIPQGSKTFKPKSAGPYPPGFYTQDTNFDFFNYAGIHRSVVLYALPPVYIDDVTITTNVHNNTANVTYSVDVINSVILKNSPWRCRITILNKEQVSVAESESCNGTIMLKDPMLWWPFTMHTNPGYQYTLKINITYAYYSGLKIGKIGSDVYFQKFGIRTISIENNKFLVNGKPFYFMGFGKHEDANIRGKGLDLPLIVKDFNLIKWIGANSFRTSHYPYSEELMDQADEQGIVVIDECPAVGLTSFTPVLLDKHKQVIKELIKRDKNRPSVFAWSVANEPKSNLKAADTYFQTIVKLVKTLDKTRPVTAALNADPETDKVGKHLDFIMSNHYYSWYDETGSTDVIFPLLINRIETAFKIYQKPIMMSEYGADTISGLHMDPPFIFTEDYQTEMMIQHHKAFDVLKEKGFFVGEHIWNFADFLTLQQLTRVVGNKKGILTRERQPKASAKVLRCRYHYLANSTIVGSAAYCPYSHLSTGSCTDY